MFRLLHVNKNKIRLFNSHSDIQRIPLPKNSLEITTAPNTNFRKDNKNKLHQFQFCCISVTIVYYK